MIRLNDHDLLELVIDLSDVTLLGTKNFLKKIEEVSNRIQVRANLEKVKYDSYGWCRDRNLTCSALLEHDYTQIFNDLIEMYYDGYS